MICYNGHYKSRTLRDGVMKKLLFIGLLGLIFSLSFTKPCLAADEFTEVTTNLQDLTDGSVAWGDHDNDGTFEDINANLPGVVGGRSSWGDYDNDGDLDVLLTGSYYAKIYRNDGNGVFTDINANLIGIYMGSAAWGDYDNDGDLDIVMMGYQMGGSTASIIYRNNGNETFTDIDANLIEVYLASAAWGDYDNDGDLDILLTGVNVGNNSSKDISKIYRNDGNGVFTDINAGLTGVQESSVAWGDYDNDGDLDILLTGHNVNYNRISKIYRNDGNGVFTDINAGLTGVSSSSVAWGDYDNDGDLDILLTGHNVNYNRISKIYRNDGNGVFTDINAGLAGVSWSSVAWGDYDNDGDLDILLTGRTSTVYVSKIYRNNSSIANTVPNEPFNPQANVLGNNVALSWDKATDNQTPQDGLYYNLYIGTSEYGVDTLSPMAEVPDGFRRIAAIGSQNENTSWAINNLPDGLYYWGVQAIDTAFAGSPFALDTFIIGEKTISGIVTASGSGLADVTLTAVDNNNVTTAIVITDKSGEYTLTLPSGWSGTVTPSKTGYHFNPYNRTYANLSSNQENQNYEAILSRYTVSGVIKDTEGKGVAGVQLKEESGWLTLAITDADGSYSFVKSFGWSGKVIPSLQNYTFSPTSRTYSNLNSNWAKQNYTTTYVDPKKRTISGIVWDKTHTYGIPGVKIYQAGQSAGILKAITDENGHYSFQVPYLWSGTIYPDYSVASWIPPTRTYHHLGTNKPNQDFRVQTYFKYTIHGRITDENGNGIQAVQLKDPGGGIVAVTNDKGYYSFTKNRGWSGTITPFLENYTFTPPNISYNNLNDNQLNQDYTGQ